MANIIQRDKTTWRLTDIIAVLFLTFVFTSVIFLLVEWIINCLFSSNLMLLIRPLILNSIQALLLAGLTLLIIKIRYKVSLKDFGFNLNNSKEIIKYGIIGGILICSIITFLNNLIHILIDNFFGIQAPTQQVIQSLLSSQNQLLFFLHSILIILVAPLTEEIFFRGFIYPYCKVKLGKAKGIFLSGLIFGLAHSSIWLLVPTFLGGVILALIYERTKSLYSCIIAHSIWNMIIVFLIYTIWKFSI
ncbi:CPBP family intramembrane glutamic endopeptidase [Orenia marismortui]|uniref:CPBP family intramembrane glutamic endopeptidase n=1 Tax=Orenia marismortui TaxID=46469 RepID=UPI00037145C2|nr:CPBP family intramembrane glutamic endopeptidase [Orenia marismortui]